MRSRNWNLAPAMIALVLALIMTPSAQAECGMPSTLAKPMSWQPAMGGAHLMRAALGNGLNDDEGGPSIVGMWHVIFIANTSNGQSIPAPGMVIDNALSVWHSDHTEIMNSVRPPQDGNFCLGVWKQAGESTYYLNHFAWYANQWPNNAANGIGAPVGPTHFTETVTVSQDGMHFSGTFTLTAYDTTGTVTQTFTGTLAGTRITTSTTMGSLL